MSATNQPVDLYIDCVILSSFGSEFTFLRNVFRLTGIHMHHAESLEEADFLLTATGSTVLLADVAFADGTWKNALDLLRERHPIVAMLVIAELIDKPFLEELFTLGGCGIVWKEAFSIRGGQAIDPSGA